MRVAFVVANEGVEQVELTQPGDAVTGAGGHRVLIGPKPGPTQAFNHLDKADTARSGSSLCHMRRRSPTPLGAVIGGAVAGAAGTVAMDGVWYYRYRKGGGKDGFLEWEFSAGLKDWDEAPAPAQIGRRVFEGLFQRELPAERAALTNNVMHWLYGLGWGAAYGLVAGTIPTRLRHGLVLGSVVWSSSYVILPLAKLYKPIWEYDLRTLGIDLSAHLAYGLGTAAAFRLLLLGGDRNPSLPGHPSG
jgi:hypothetical protein